jgi:hypothetical protein
LTCGDNSSSFPLLSFLPSLNVDYSESTGVGESLLSGEEGECIAAGATIFQDSKIGPEAKPRAPKGGAQDAPNQLFPYSTKAKNEA